MEGLRHLPQEVLGHLDALVHRQVEVGVRQVLLDPAGQLSPFVGTCKPLKEDRQGISTGGLGPHDPRMGNQEVGRVREGSHLVGKDHEAVVGLAPDGATHALGGVAHGVKGEEVILPDLELVPQVLEPRLGMKGPAVGLAAWPCPSLDLASPLGSP